MSDDCAPHPSILPLEGACEEGKMEGEGGKKEGEKEEEALFQNASLVSRILESFSGLTLILILDSILFYSILFYSILFYSILFYSILFYSILFYSILFYSILFYSILFYSILFYSILFYSILFYSILFYSILFYSILFYSILFYSILFYSILFYSILLLLFLTPFFQDISFCEMFRLPKNQRLVWAVKNVEAQRGVDSTTFLGSICCFQVCLLIINLFPFY